MKTIALMQVYNEDLFISRQLSWLIDCVDEIIITEGCLTPHANQPKRSCDHTRESIKTFTETYDKENKIKFYDTFDPEPKPHSREQWEGLNKNFMLKKSSIENGDIIYIADCDEFYHKDKFLDIINRFKKNDELNHVPVEEFQFAYNLELCFNASHDGRFMRYVNGSKFGTTNHFVHPDGKDITKDYSNLINKEDSSMCHFCWLRHPEFIKEKVLSFSRLSFTLWYNNVYLIWPHNSEIAYVNNSRIAPYFGTGFCEGQHNKLEKFGYKLPKQIAQMKIDWLDYVRKNQKSLRI